MIEISLLIVIALVLAFTLGLVVALAHYGHFDSDWMIAIAFGLILFFSYMLPKAGLVT